MASKSAAPATQEDIRDIEHSMFGGVDTLGVFRGVRAYVDVYAVVSDSSTTLPFCALNITAAQIRFYGGDVDATINNATTHIVLDPRDSTRLDAFLEILRGKPKRPHIVTSEWVRASAQAGCLRDEEQFFP